MVEAGHYANRSEAIKEAVAELIAYEKNKLRAFPKSLKKPSILSEHVRKVKNDLRRAKF